MGIFDDQKLNWRGAEYVIPANKVLGAIARIEDVVTLPELAAWGERKSVPISRLAQAYGAVLRYAGADVSDEDVYGGMFGQGSTQLQVMQGLFVLLQMMVPKNFKAPGAQPPGNRAARRKAAAGSSKSRTRQQSATV